MAHFRYKAKQGPQKVVEGKIEADSQDAAIGKITRMGLYPLTVLKEEEGIPGGPAKRPILALTVKQKIKVKDREAFTRQLADLLNGGLSLFRALDLLVQETEHKGMRSIIEQLRDQVKEGVPLSMACSRFPKVFSPLYTNMVKAGEVGGMLDKVLHRLAEFAEKEEDTRTKIKAALAYPIFLCSVGTVTVLVLLLFVIPKLTVVFEDLGQTLPLPTLILVGFSHFLVKYWWVALLLVAGLLLLIKNKGVFSGKSLLFDRLLLKMPLVGPLLKKREISRFASTLGTLLGNGVPILRSLEIVSDNIHNQVYKEEVARVLEEVSKGNKLGDTLKSCPSFPLAVSHMVNVGEETGNLEKVLEKISEAYDREVDQATKIFTALLEPILILVLGIVIAFIVMAMLLPIFSIDVAAGG